MKTKQSKNKLKKFQSGVTWAGSFVGGNLYPDEETVLEMVGDISKKSNIHLEWVHSNFPKHPPTDSVLAPLPGTHLFEGENGKGKLKPTTTKFLRTLKHRGRSPSDDEVLKYLRRGGRGIVMYQAIREGLETPEWRDWSKEVRLKIRDAANGLRKLRQIVTKYQLPEAPCVELNDKITAMKAVHDHQYLFSRYSQIGKSGKIFVTPMLVQLYMIVPNLRKAYGFPRSLRDFKSKNTKIQHLRAWNAIIRALIDYLKPYCTPETRYAKKEHTISNKVYEAVAKILSIEFQGTYPNKFHLVAQRYRTIIKPKSF